MQATKSKFFDKDFYPTPKEVIYQMIDGLDLEGKTVYEPQAGKGDIVDVLKEQGANVIATEKNEDLAKIVGAKCKLIGTDFLKIKAEQISHINYIISNPPFSKGDKHLLHAWNIAPDGCEIVCLLNQETINNLRYSDHRELKQIIDSYGNITELGNCFSTAERKTKVEVVMIKLYKPILEGDNEFEGFFMGEEPQEAQENGIMTFNVIRDVVQRYVHSVQCFDEHLKIAERMNSLTKPFGVESFEFKIDYNNSVCTKEDFKKAIQKKAWQYIFDKMNMEKYVTTNVLKDINKFVNSQQQVPFTMRNIYKMFEIIVGTREETFKKSLTEAVDHFTKHIHENRYAVEGWKTNEGHLLAEKFIVPYICEVGWSGQMGIRYSSYRDDLGDLVKVLCSITGTDYNTIPALSTFVSSNKCEFGKWYRWGFFEIRGYKKGTMHMKFIKRDDWARLNQQYAKAKGQVLPEKI